jgi:hypothetical protein
LVSLGKGEAPLINKVVRFERSCDPFCYFFQEEPL